MSIQGKLKSLNYIRNEFRKNVRDYSFGIGCDRMLERLRFLSPEKKESLHQQFIYKYVKKELLPVIRETVQAYDPSEREPAERRIWVMWWQGEESMPELVKACYRQLLSVKGSYQVILITESNFRDYVELPEHILAHVADGSISLTHLSDIIRCKLLLDHGGLYLDATIYADDISFVEDYDFYTLRTPGKYPNFISRGDWTGFAMSEKYTNALEMQCLYNGFCAYWRNHSAIVDYLLIDYVIRCIYDEVEEVRAKMQAVPEQDGYYTFDQTMNQPYDPDAFRAMISRCPWQKLSYKRELKKTASDGKMSNFGYLVSKEAMENM